MAVLGTTWLAAVILWRFDLLGLVLDGLVVAGVAVNAVALFWARRTRGHLVRRTAA